MKSVRYVIRDRVATETPADSPADRFLFDRRFDPYPWSGFFGGMPLMRAVCR